jgi:glutamate carboxypeptidase
MKHARHLWPLIASLALICAPANAATSLTSSERQIVASVDAHASAGLDLLVRSVNINSGTMNFEGVRDVAKLFRPEFEKLGFSVRWVDGAAWNRAGHLVATRRGRPGGIRLLLIGHLDTVFEKDSPFQRFEPLSDSTARGPGVIDMKGGDVIMLLALRSLADTGELDRLSVTVVLSGDEEKAGDPLDLARRDLRAAAESSDVAIGFEDGDGDPHHAVIARRGAGDWRLRTAGQPAHSSLIFRDEIGSGAIYEAARILEAFHDSLSREPYLTLNPGAIVGGTTVTFDADAARGTAFGKTNVIAESTTVTGDLRALSIEQREHAKHVMRGIVAASPPHASAAIDFTDGYPPLAPTAGNRALLEIYDQASRDLGFGAVEAVDPARAGAADVSFTAGILERAIDGIGLRGDGGHTVKETAELRTLPVQAKRAALLMDRLAKDGHRGGK